MSYEYNGKIYKTKVEMQMAKRRDSNKPLPLLDFTCTGDGCECPHHKEA